MSYCRARLRDSAIRAVVTDGFAATPGLAALQTHAAPERLEECRHGLRSKPLAPSCRCRFDPLVFVGAREIQALLGAAPWATAIAPVMTSALTPVVAPMRIAASIARRHSSSGFRRWSAHVTLRDVGDFRERARRELASRRRWRGWRRSSSARRRA